MLNDNIDFKGCDFDKITKLRNKMLTRKATISAERAKIITKVYKENEEKSYVLKKALGLKEVLSKMKLYIEPNSLIIGNQTERNFCAPVYPEYSIDWLVKELDSFALRKGDSFEISENDKKIIQEIAPYWEGKTHKDEVLRNLNKVNFLAEKQGVLHRGGISMSGDGHIIPDYTFVLETGFSGVISICKKKLEGDLSKAKKDYYQATIISMEGAIIYCQRFVVLLKEQFLIDKDKKWQDLIEVFENIISGNITSFQAAVEMVYLIHVLMMIESNGHSFSFGRFDQYLNKYYEHDIQNKLISKGKALEIITDFFIMCNSLNKVRPWGHTEYSGGYPLYSNLMLGGVDKNGKDVTNELSFLCLEAMSLSAFPEPNLSARIDDDTSYDFIKTCAKLIKKGFGMPSLFYDNVCIESLLRLNIPLEVARCYASIGCVEIGIPGYWGHRATGMTYVNFGKIIELVMNNGLDKESGIQLISINGKSTNEIGYSSYEEVFAAWEKLLSYYTKLAVDCDLVCDRALKKHDSDPFASAFIHDSLTRGKTLKNGGCRYDFVSSSNVGPTVVADSLMAIKDLVFDKKIIKLKDLQTALNNNFIEYEKIKRLCLNEPKFGNDIDEVDKICASVYESYLKLTSSLKTDRYKKGPIGGTYTMSTSNITSYVPCGFDVGATPNGREAKKPLNEGCSPCLGADKNGPTAIINSVAKLPNKKMSGGQLLNMKFSPQSLEKEAGLEKFTYFLIACKNKNIFHNQFNIVDNKTSIAAKNHPEDYPNLMVRVAGYCALFNTLTPEAKDAIIKRTELNL